MPLDINKLANKQDAVLIQRVIGTPVTSTSILLLKALACRRCGHTVRQVLRSYVAGTPRPQELNFLANKRDAVVLRKLFATITTA